MMSPCIQKVSAGVYFVLMGRSLKRLIPNFRAHVRFSGEIRKNFEERFWWLDNLAYLCTQIKNSEIKIMMCNTYKYNVNPMLRLGRKVAPANGTACFYVFASVDLVI